MPSADLSFIALSTDGRRYVFNVLAVRPEVRYDWDFGDPASGSANQARGPEALHRYADAGVYAVRLTANGSDGDGPVTVRREVTVGA